MARNKDLIAANKAKKDEFYTQLNDIENELRHYRQHFQGKTVLCNCDDPYESNFFRYFALNFNRLGLKKLMATCYSGSPLAGTQLSLFGDETEEERRTPYKAIVTTVHDTTGDGGVDILDVAELFRNGENSIEKLEGDGDFRSAECVALLDKADIVVTNPPFSLFREYVAQLIEHEKKFIIIGNQNAFTYKDIFQLFMENKIWVGPSIHSGDRKFNVPDDYPLNAAGCGIDPDGRKWVRVKGVRWFTNLDFKQRHEEMILVKRYDPELYPTYANYDAIEVSKTSDIPCDYAGLMGVPITFLDKYNPDQFEIIGQSRTLGRPMSEIAKKGEYVSGGVRFYLRDNALAAQRSAAQRSAAQLSAAQRSAISTAASTTESSSGTGTPRYRRLYDRIVIRNKHPEEPRT